MKVVQTEEVDFSSVYESIEDHKMYSLNGKELREMILEFSYQILDSIPASVYWKDLQGKVLGCNQYMLEVLNYKSRDEIIGKTNLDLLSLQTAEQVNQIDQKVIREGKKIEIEELMESPHVDDGIWVFTSKQPILSKKNKIVGVIGCSFDISMQKKAEKKAREEEELRITAEINIIQEERKSIALQEEEKALKMLTGSIAHDTKNRLSPIRMRLEMLLMIIMKIQNYGIEILNTRELEILYTYVKLAIQDIDYANQEIVKMNQYIQYRTTNNQTLYYLNELQMGKCIKEVLHSYQTGNYPKIYNQVDEFPFNGDPIMIYKILNNLIQNAIRQIQEKGKGEIFFSTDFTKKYYILKVKDTAGEVTQDLVDRILDLHKTGEVKGTGIGLSSAQILMQEMGGKLEVQLVDKDCIEFLLFFPRKNIN